MAHPEYLSKNCGLCNEPVEQHSSWQSSGKYLWHTSCARDGLNQLLNDVLPFDEYLKTLFDRDGGKPSPPSASSPN